jgi:hypothetical protein
MLSIAGGMLAVITALAAAPTASAIPYFTGPNGFGFDNEALPDPLEVDYTIESPDRWAPAGSKVLNDGSFALVLIEKQKLVKKDDFWRVNVKLKIRNATGETLDQAALFFAALGGPPKFPDYRGIPIDLSLKSSKNRDLDILSYGEGESQFYFAGFLLENMAPGRDGQVVRKFHYDVERLVGAEAPAIGVAAVLEVPEPSLLVLALTAALAAGGRLRRP